MTRKMLAHWWILPSRIWHFLVPPLKVTKNVLGSRVYMCLRDNLTNIVSTNQIEKDIENLFKIPCQKFWDVGSNIGIYSIVAASKGKDVTAFDISVKAVSLLKKSAKANGLSIKTCTQGLSVNKVSYQKVTSSQTRNKIIPADNEVSSHTLPYAEAADKYGVPDLIKMDIEGYELKFFESSEFKKWIIDNGIIWEVELHSQHIIDNIWKDVPHDMIRPRHVIYNAK